MRPWIATATVILCVLFLQPAAAGGWRNRTQEVRGRVFASVYPDAGGCIDANWRSGGIIGGPANGVTSYRFEVESPAIGRRFVLESATDRQVDFDIAFVDETDPLVPKKIDEMANRGNGPEWGRVPRGTMTAYVCLYEGRDASFRFTAGQKVKWPKT